MATLVSYFVEIFVSYEARIDRTSFKPCVSEDDQRAIVLGDEFIVNKEAVPAIQLYFWLPGLYLNPPSLTE